MYSTVFNVHTSTYKKVPCCSLLGLQKYCAYLYVNKVEFTIIPVLQ